MYRPRKPIVLWLGWILSFTAISGIIWFANKQPGLAGITWESFKIPGIVILAGIAMGWLFGYEGHMYPFFMGRIDPNHHEEKHHTNKY